MNDPAANSHNSERLRDQLFGAKLEAAEARMDARIASIEATLAAFIERMDERFARIESKFAEIDVKFSQIALLFARMEGRMSGIEARLANLEATVGEIKSSISGLKTTMIVTAIAAVIGVATFNATVMSNMISAFESGKNVSEAQAKILRQSEETAALLREIKQGLLVPAPKQQPAR
jgi:anti-sigma-K factor RskA